MTGLTQNTQKILIVNAFNYLTEGYIRYCLENSLFNKKEIYLVDQTLDNDFFKEISSFENIKVLNYSTFFKSTINEQKFSHIIYNSIYEKGNASQLTDYSNNFKNLLIKAQTYNPSISLLVPISPDIKAVDYIKTITSLAQGLALSNLNVKIINLGTPYGPNMPLDRDTAISRIILDSIKKDKITITGENFFNYYIYIDDAARGINLSLDIQTPGIFTLSDPFDLSVSSLALRVSEIIGKKVDNQTENALQDHLKTLPYILPGWKPENNIEKGLEKTFIWIKEINLIKNTDSIKINDISTEPPQPIRNYTPKEFSVFRDVPENSLEFNPLYDLNRSKNLKSIEDIKKQAGFNGDVIKDESSIKNIISNIKNIPFKIRFEKKAKIENPISKKNTIIFAIFTLVFFLLHTFIFSPIFWIAKSYTNLNGKMAYVNNSNIDSFIQDVNTLRDNYKSLYWAFNLFSQTKRYDNLLESINTSRDFLESQRNYLKISNEFNSSIESFRSQNTNIETSLNSLQKDQIYSYTYSLLNNSLIELSSYIPYFPADSTKLKAIILSEIQSLNKINTLSPMLNTMIANSPKYLVVTTKREIKDNIYTSDNISNIYSISLKNGLYQGTTLLQNNSKISEISFSNFANALESNYVGSYTGVILITPSAISSLNLQSSSNPVDSIVKSLTTNSSNTTLKSLAYLLKNNSLQIFVNNFSFSKDDIINNLN